MKPVTLRDTITRWTVVRWIIYVGGIGATLPRYGILLAVPLTVAAIFVEVACVFESITKMDKRAW